MREMAYDKSFKEEAVKLAQEIGTRKASEQLGLSFYTLREWRRTQERYGEKAFVGSGHKQTPLDPQEQKILEMEKEIRELKRANEILQEALGFFAANRKK